MLQSNAQVAQELEITKQEIDYEGGVDLGQHGVLVVADEGLDPQVLLDDAEEDLDLPAFFVDIGDGLGRQLEMVGEKDIAPAGGGIPVGVRRKGTGPSSPVSRMIWSESKPGFFLTCRRSSTS